MVVLPSKCIDIWPSRASDLLKIERYVKYEIEKIKIIHGRLYVDYKHVNILMMSVYQLLFIPSLYSIPSAQKKFFDSLIDILEEINCQYVLYFYPIFICN